MQNKISNIGTIKRLKSELKELEKSVTVAMPHFR